MEINYSDELVVKGKKSIFLAGPTPRGENITSWREEAVKILENLSFDGLVYVPDILGISLGTQNTIIVDSSNAFLSHIA